MVKFIQKNSPVKLECHFYTLHQWPNYIRSINFSNAISYQRWVMNGAYFSNWAVENELRIYPIALAWWSNTVRFDCRAEKLHSNSNYFLSSFSSLHFSRKTQLKPIARVCVHRTCIRTTDFYWNIFMKNERDMTYRQALKVWENDCMRRLSKRKHITGIKTIVDANSDRHGKSKWTRRASHVNSSSVSTDIFIFFIFIHMKFLHLFWKKNPHFHLCSFICLSFLLSVSYEFPF